MISSRGCQPVVCTGGHCLAQLRDPDVSVLCQSWVRVGAPQLTPPPSLEPEVLPCYPQGDLASSTI